MATWWKYVPIIGILVTFQKYWKASKDLEWAFEKFMKSVDAWQSPHASPFASITTYRNMVAEGKKSRSALENKMDARDDFNDSIAYTVLVLVIIVVLAKIFYHR